MSARWTALACALLGSTLAASIKASPTEGLYSRAVRRTGLPDPFDWYSIQPSDKIVWTDCEGVFKCARLNLPLDYLDPSDNRTTAIALQLLPAKDKANYRGTILINPGGPGNMGTDFATLAAADIAAIVGDSFDILGFDPRGVGASTPRADCFDDDAERQPWIYGNDDRLLDPEGRSLPMILAKERVIARRCEEKIGGPDGIGRFLGTASVARDMLEITKQLGQDKVQYWGFSYGSVLGQYFAAMYPDKVGRLVLDGVYDADNYRAGLWSSNLEDTEKVLAAFGELCFQAGPERCLFFSDSADDINARVLATLDKLEAAPIPLPLARTPGLLTAEVIRQLVLVCLSQPRDTFLLMAIVLDAIERNDTDLLGMVWDGFRGNARAEQCDAAATPPWLARSEAQPAISCADADPLTFSEPEFTTFYRNLTEVSPLAAPVWGELHLACTAWKVRAGWRYTGEFAATNTSAPLLAVQPRLDPLAPLSDARKVVARYGGAGLLVQNSYGHTSRGASSACTAKHVRAYFEDGTLPPEGTVCEPDGLPFDGVPGGVPVKREDGEFLDALTRVRGRVPMLGHSGHF